MKINTAHRLRHPFLKRSYGVSLSMMLFHLAANSAWALQPPLLGNASSSLPMPSSRPSPSQKNQLSDRATDSLKRLVFKLPDRGAPGSREGGASRSNTCITANHPTLTALMPNTNLGYTTSLAPTLFWYVPPTTASNAEFILQTAEGDEVYREVLPLSKTGGITHLRIPNLQETVGFTAGQSYHWYFTLLCNVEEPSLNVTVEGWIQHVTLSVEQQSRLQAVQPQDRPRWFAQAGIWYDALTELAVLRQQEPGTLIALQDWNDLLQSVQLDFLSKQPLLSCCNREKHWDKSGTSGTL